MTEGELILYTTEDGKTAIRLRAEEGTVWLTQLELAELFQTSKQNISLHIKNVLSEGELDEGATVKDYLTVQIEGNREIKRNIQLYNLDMILSVGYRVKSQRGTQFRQWATTHLREYLIKGFVMDDARLKEPGGWDYFDELLERIRDIRTSEKRFYQKVRDIYVTAADYDAKSEQAQQFFKKVQNKMLWAITGHTPLCQFRYYFRQEMNRKVLLTFFLHGILQLKIWKGYLRQRKSCIHGCSTG